MARQNLIRQLAVKVEAARGVWETDLDTDATASAFADFVFRDPTWTQTPFSAEVDYAMPSHARPPDHFAGEIGNQRGTSIVEVRFTVELAGHVTHSAAVPAVEPPFARILQGCGYESVLINAYPITSYTAGTASVFQHGEIVTGDGGGAFNAEVFGSSAPGVNPDRLFVRTSSITGFAAGAESITGSVSGAVAATDTFEVISRWGMAPLNTDEKTVSILFATEGRRVKVRGSMGSARFTFTPGEMPEATFRFVGLLHASEDAALMSGANAPTMQHPESSAVNGMGLLIDPQPGGVVPPFAPTYSRLAIEIANELVFHPNGNAPAGYDYARILERSPTLEFDPDENTGDANDETAFERGHRHHVSLSSGTIPGNIIEARIPAAVISERDESPRDADTAMAHTFKLHAAQAQHSDLDTGRFPNRPFAGDCELVLINR